MHFFFVIVEKEKCSHIANYQKTMAVLQYGLSFGVVTQGPFPYQTDSIVM